MERSFLNVVHINKTFGHEHVLRDVSFALGAKQVLSIIGASGSGKTTLLRIIAGLEEPDSGHIEVEGKRLDGLPPRQRQIVYLYQEPLLFPHLNVFENVAFGLKLRKLGRKEIRAKAYAMLSSLDLDAHATKMPHELSGGQRQRVSFGRALIVNPRLLLLDEPFGALDTQTRARMQVFLKEVVETFGITTVFVTHDLKEALIMGQEMGTMRAGNLEVYPDKEAFVRDGRNGVGKEARFWSEWLNDDPSPG